MESVVNVFAPIVCCVYNVGCHGEKQKGDLFDFPRCLLRRPKQLTRGWDSRRLVSSASKRNIARNPRTSFRWWGLENISSIPHFSELRHEKCGFEHSFWSEKHRHRWLCGCFPPKKSLTSVWMLSPPSRRCVRWKTFFFYVFPFDVYTKFHFHKRTSLEALAVPDADNNNTLKNVKIETTKRRRKTKIIFRWRQGGKEKFPPLDSVEVFHSAQSLFWTHWVSTKNKNCFFLVELKKAERGEDFVRTLILTGCVASVSSPTYALLPLSSCDNNC